MTGRQEGKEERTRQIFIEEEKEEGGEGRGVKRRVKQSSP